MPSDQSSKTNLRFRQVHMDFHTSEHITGIGDRFDPDEFAETLTQAHVDSVTCFARCHHGWLYYESEKFPERHHPHLSRNLLKEQIEACHARDIRVPIYVTIQWDQFTANEHPEWLALDETGRILGTEPYEAGFYRRLCVNSPYIQFLRDHVREILNLLPVDGFFFDIVNPLDDSSKWSRIGMKAEGLNPADPTDRAEYGRLVIANFQRELTAFVHQINPNCTVFYNSGHVGPRMNAIANTYTHFEIESLPSGGWGYTHFPLSARYARTLGLEIMGMTGKFHTMWGDFHSFKTPEALEFECFTALAMGGVCSIGDQLLPHGAIDPVTYDLIGGVYGQVEAKEPWCKGAQAVAEIGVFSPEEFSFERIPVAAAGVMKMLQEGGHQFNFIDTQQDFSAYKLVILPDEIPVSDAFAQKLQAYVDGGGAVIASYKSGLNSDGTRFAWDALGVSLVGDAPYSPDFIMPKGAMGEGLPETEHVMYLRGLEVEANNSTETLLDTYVPYFNRTWQHFISHRHTPSAGKVGYPAVTQNGNVVYFVHPICTQYEHTSPRWCKQLFLNAVNLLLPQPLVQHDGPSTLIVTLNRQNRDEAKRYVLHTLHYVPVRRSEIDVIEDVLPIYDVTIHLHVPESITSVKLAPEGDVIVTTQNGDVTTFTILKIEGHQMVEISIE